MKSLKAAGSLLSDSDYQLEVLSARGTNTLIPFQERLEQHALYPLKPSSINTLQINVGKMCNQVCRHCHVDAGPDRKEIMTLQTMQQCLEVLRNKHAFTTVDLTGGAPELNPNFRWFVSEIKNLGKHVIVRCNLTIILANRRFNDLPEFFKEHQVEVVSSLPFYVKERTDRQRGNGVFDDSIKALQMLNNVGYGLQDSPLTLNLVYNPAGAFMPPDQTSLEREYKQALWKEYKISFNNLYVITNMPISRYLDYLLQSGNYEKYMMKLTNAFNPAAAENVMCRSTISVGWDGYIYDCDFNQMLDMKADVTNKHISSLNFDELLNRDIVINQHCFGCTAGSGSSCGGAVA